MISNHDVLFTKIKFDAKSKNVAVESLLVSFLSLIQKELGLLTKRSNGEN